ncbi:putative membrane protein [Streptococcus mitis]|uniref:Putative membrane protein n=1 Tax=Streptococcus mitis TaxID=28037 RepID=A0A081QAU7_STRMT|nr:putative membrane protein [Streptococcus mitis]
MLALKPKIAYPFTHAFLISLKYNLIKFLFFPIIVPVFSGTLGL